MTLATPTRSRRKIAIKSYLLILAVAAIIGLCSTMQAQKFQSVPALAFTMPFGGANPLPQIVTSASTSTSFGFYQKTSTSSGGNWLSAPNCNNGDYPCGTPSTVAVIVSASGLAAGTYQGQIEFISTSNSSTMTVPVTL